jgi:hypothetical protein
MSFVVPSTQGVGVAFLILGFVAYKIVAYFIDLSERQCPACGERARRGEAYCNSCGASLAST